jgi:LysM repeat protein
LEEPDDGQEALSQVKEANIMGSRVLRLAAALLLLAVALLPAHALAAPLSGDGDVVHVVKAGETLEEIADAYGVTVTAILVANEMDGPDDLKVAMRLVIPMEPETLAAAVEGEHIVARGETLTSIAADYGITMAALAAANDMLITEELVVGQALIIPEAVSPYVSSSQVICIAYHLVQKGDTLTRIANDYGTTIPAIQQANELTTDVIWTGQKLCIPSLASMVTGMANVTPATADAATAASTYQPTAAYNPPEYKPPSGISVATVAPEYAQPVYSTGVAELNILPVYPSPEPHVIRTERAWVGTQTADFLDPDSINTLVVLTWEKKDLNIVIRSRGGFVGAGTTGEYYEFSWVPNFAFRAIPAGIYDIWIENEPCKIATAEVKDGRRTIVDFKMEETLPDTIGAASVGGWGVDMLENTCGTVDKGVSSILVVRTGANGQRIRVTAPGGYEATCTTGAKMEHGPGACNIGGLSAGTYQVTVDGSGTWLELYLDGQCTATVEFHPR